MYSHIIFLILFVNNFSFFKSDKNITFIKDIIVHTTRTPKIRAFIDSRIIQKSGLIDLKNNTKEFNKMTEPFANFPNIPLCKDVPDSEKSIYSNVYCYVLLALYFMLIFSLVIWQIKWIYYLRDRINGHGHDTNRKDNAVEYDNPKILSRMLPKRQNT
jgi:hypothetical protein